MFHMADAGILLTKASGKTGGFAEKMTAAQKCGMRVAVLSRPSEKGGLTLGEMKQKIEDKAI
jgi:precorrin-6x reductase